ncbi:MAG: alpha/beta fold hydrolase [Pseudomonadota bacterium]
MAKSMGQDDGLIKAQEVPYVVMVHGLWFREHWLRVLGKRLGDAGFRVMGFGYNSTRMPFEASAARLQELCDRNFLRGAHFIGHSLGGLLILRMLQLGEWDRPGKVLFMGTPLNGSAIARRTAHWPGASFMLGTAALPLQEGIHYWPEERTTGMIAGDRPLGIGRFAGGLEKPHDGTVPVSETQNPKLDEHITLPVTHTGMIFSPAVARQAASFLSRGRFVPVSQYRRTQYG